MSRRCCCLHAISISPSTDVLAFVVHELLDRLHSRCLQVFYYKEFICILSFASHLATNQIDDSIDNWCDASKLDALGSKIDLKVCIVKGHVVAPPPPNYSPSRSLPLLPSSTTLPNTTHTPPSSPSPARPLAQFLTLSGSKILLCYRQCFRSRLPSCVSGQTCPP